MKWFNPQINLGNIISIFAFVVSITIVYANMGAKAQETSRDLAELQERAESNSEDIDILKQNYAVITEQLRNIIVLQGQQQGRTDDIVNIITVLRGDLIRLQTLIQSMETF